MIRKKNIKRNPFLKPGGGFSLIERFPKYGKKKIKKKEGDKNVNNFKKISIR